MFPSLRRLRARVRYRRFDADLQQELDVHRAMAEDNLRARGTEPGDVGHLAARQLGNTLAARQAARGVWIAPWLESVWQDVRYGARGLVRSRGFTATALLTLMLGIGVNTTLFALVNAVLLRPWPLPDAHRLVRIYHRAALPAGEQLVGVSGPELVFLQQLATSVDVAGTRQIGGPLVVGDATRPVNGRLVSGNYFDVLAAPLASGRGLTPADDRVGSAPVAVISHQLWTSLFASDPSVVGRTIRFRDLPMTVVGVAGPSLRQSPLEGLPELWVPLAAMPSLFPGESFAREFLTNPAHCCVDVVGRLRPGLNQARAEAELTVLDRRFRSAEPRDSAGMKLTSTATIDDPKAARVVPAVGLMSAAVGLVLLLTCANVGNLQLARAAARRREVTVRLALGAARGRVVRQMLTEGLVLSAVAVALCLYASPLAARLVMTRFEAKLAQLLDFSIDARVLSFAVCITLATCLITSLAPALRSTRHLVAGRTSDRRTLRTRSIFLAAQIAISVVLLIAAALLDRGLAQAASQDLGFRIDGLAALELTRRSADAETDRVVLRGLTSAMKDMPVAVAASVPLDEMSFHTGVRRAGDPAESDQPTRFQPVSANYFDVLDIPLKAGRTFREGDPNEVVVNETLARVLWPDGGAVGSYLAGPDDAVGRQVVGIASDAHIDGMGAVGPTLFQSVEKPTFLLFDRSTVSPDALRAIVGAVDSSATTTLQAVGDNVAASLESATLGARIAGGFGVLALGVAAIGIAGVFSFVVTERTREIGIHLALGASRRRLRALLLAHHSRPLVGGLVAGLLVAMMAGPVLRGFLYGLSPTSPSVFGGVALLVVVTAWVATLMPLRRALNVDPASTLRHE